MITALDFLYLSLAIGFLVLVFFVVTLINRVMRTLDSLDLVLDDVRNTTGEIRNLKEKAKSTFFSTASILLGMLYGKRR
jgi:uncharacterized protein YoxC